MKFDLFAIFAGMSFVARTVRAAESTKVPARVNPPNMVYPGVITTIKGETESEPDKYTQNFLYCSLEPTVPAELKFRFVRSDGKYGFAEYKTKSTKRTGRMSNENSGMKQVPCYEFTILYQLLQNSVANAVKNAIYKDYASNPYGEKAIAREFQLVAKKANGELLNDGAKSIFKFSDVPSLPELNQTTDDSQDQGEENNDNAEAP